MADYIDLELTLDATTLYDDAVAAIGALAPEDWEPSELEQWLLEAIARMGVELSILAGRVPIEIFKYFGDSILDVPALGAAPATSTVTFTLVDDAGHTIDAGTYLTIDGVAFTIDDILEIPTGSSVATVGVTAVATGTIGNELDGTAIDVISPSYLFIDSVVLNAPTANGTDGETGEEYADRLADELPTLSPKAILIEDFETIARRNPLVGRALAIDNYNPTGPDPAAEGHVSIVVHDVDGADLASDVRDDIADDLEGNRVLNLNVHVLSPTRQTLSVSATCVAYDDYDTASVKADVEAAIAAFLNATTWGSPSAGNTTRWINETTVYRTDLIGVVRNVPGVRHVTALTFGFNKAATAVAATDVITVTAHGYLANDPVVFTALTGGAGLVAGTTYYVRDVTTNTFKVSATPGGTAMNITTDLSAGTIHAAGTADLVMTGVAPLPVAGTITATVT